MKRKSLTRSLLALLLAVVFCAATFVPAFAAEGLTGARVKQSRKIAEMIEDEGIVLIKNKSSFLPLQTRKVNVFGAKSEQIDMSGGGSGTVPKDDPIEFYEGLTNAGFEYNTELEELYAEYKSENPLSDGTGIPVLDQAMDVSLDVSQLEEMPVSRISDEVLQNAKAYSDTALVVIGRCGTEGSDLEPEELQLKEDEKDLMDLVCGNFKNVVVILNTSNILDLNFLDEYDSIKGCLLMWLCGEAGCNSVGNVLAGNVNPSGKLPDTVAKSINDYPSTRNFGDYSYQNGSNFVEYEEGIYNGYRYFETFAKDKVLYPFGFGLSYTTFDWTVKSRSVKDGVMTIKVNVKNTGKAAGKDVVQVYFSAPYTRGGIEKSAIELAGYQKTKLLKPGKSQTVAISFKIADMASYDEKDKQAWVLEKGAYKIHVAHDVETFEKSFTYNIKKTHVYKKDDTTGTKIKNYWQDAEGGLTFLSRANPKSTYPTAPTDFTTPDAVKNADERTVSDPEGAVAPKIGVTYESGNIMLADVYNDPSLWDKFLDQFTLDEMVKLISRNGYGGRSELERLGVPGTDDNDGPSVVKGTNGQLYSDYGVSYPVEFCLASTWNDRLAETFGRSVGKDAKELGVEVWYAPGLNLHRNPMGGRNFEYFSEDPLLSGKMAAAVTRGAQSQRLVVTLKHFVANEQETNRNGVFTWLSEQSMRELYLEPFEIAVKEGGAVGVMAAFDRIGADWCSADGDLLINVLRNEWGFTGYVISDYYTSILTRGYSDPVLAVYGGNDAFLSHPIYTVTQATQNEAAMKAEYRRNPYSFGNALRRCVKSICTYKMFSLAFDPSTATGHTGN